MKVILALTVVMDPVVWQDPLHKQTSMSQFVVVVSAGFFFWDFVVCSLEPFRDGAAFVLHGLLSFIVFGYMVASGHMHTYGECTMHGKALLLEWISLDWLLDRYPSFSQLELLGLMGN